LTQVEIVAGRLLEAAAHLTELEALSKSESLSVSAAEAQLLRARLHQRNGDDHAAKQAAHAALMAAPALPAHAIAIDAAEILAGLASDRGAYREAARFYGAAAANREQTGYRLRIFRTDQEQLEHTLGTATWKRANQEGRTLGIDGIMAAYAEGGNVDGQLQDGQVSTRRPFEL
jgi:hypothetical protein